MKIEKRYLHQAIAKDLLKKMVFIGGPRQVGKTTLAQFIGDQQFSHPLYLNWDNREDRKKIVHSTFEGNTDLIIFDELHKYKSWKNHIKGIYDHYKKTLAILVTGSARLDLYRRGGDSLLGRYHYYRLHPFSLAEMMGKSSKWIPFKALKIPECSPSAQENFDALLQFGGFPEPLFEHNQRTLRRWHNERLERLVKEDIRDVEIIRDLSSLQILVDLLAEKAGGQLSLNSLREDLEVTHKTVSLWVDILERFYYHFRIYPFSTKTIKSLRKEPKLYLWDWSSIPDEGRRFENLIASHLLKFVHFLYDHEGYKAELYYLRDLAKREVDFLVTIDRKPWFAVEVKTSDEEPSQSLHYFGERLKIPFLYQVVRKSPNDLMKDGVRIVGAEKFLQALI